MAAPMSNMTFVNFNKICSLCAKIQSQHGLMLRYGSFYQRTPAVFMAAVQTRSIVSNKHFDPKWRKLRAQKVQKIDLPDYEKIKRDSNMTPDEQRAHFKREGINPPRSHEERDLMLTSTNAIFESYIPPEGDGVASIVSGERVKQGVKEIGKKTKSFAAMRKIKQLEDFDSKRFAEQALDLYRETNELLMDIEKNKDRLHELVTEKAYPEMVWLLEKKTFRWEYIQALEPPRVVHIRTTDMISKENLYGQVTVRLHTQQTLAIYDRFGRLTFGSEHLVKDSLEYVVFEKHISDENSAWRIHGKLIPEWMPQRQNVLRTMRMPNFQQEEEETSDKKSVQAA